jgi:hypothetical protein
MMAGNGKHVYYFGWCPSSWDFEHKVLETGSVFIMVCKGRKAPNQFSPLEIASLDDCWMGKLKTMAPVQNNNHVYCSLQIQEVSATIQFRIFHLPIAYLRI